MKKRTVVSGQNLPVYLPLGITISVGLLLDRLAAPGWVWGVLGSLFAVWWIAALIDICHRDYRTPQWAEREDKR